MSLISLVLLSSLTVPTFLINLTIRITSYNVCYTKLLRDIALNDIRSGKSGHVPNHIKTSSTTYLYPHNYPNGYVKQQYLPDELKNKEYYNPKTTSKYERGLKDRITSYNVCYTKLLRIKK